MSRVPALSLSLALLLSLSQSLGASRASAATCTPTGYSRDDHELTAAQIGGTAGDTLDASGCDIGVYYGPGTAGAVAGAIIHGAKYFGVVANGASVDVTDSEIFAIGEAPLNGAQHGVAVYYTNGATGDIRGNHVHGYQKGGIVASLAGTHATVVGNTVQGEGPVGYIAQNGIQISFGATGTVTDNIVTGHFYTGPGWSSTGILLFDVNASEVRVGRNRFAGNQINFNLTEDNACPHLYGGVYADWGLCG